MAEDIAPASVPVKILDVEELAATIRREFEEVRRAGCNALHHAMKAGDALNDAQERITGNWKRWLRENCFVSVRTAFLYQRLARHRDQIEAAMSAYPSIQAGLSSYAIVLAFWREAIGQRRCRSCHDAAA
jgi:hypothetical protein